MIAAEAPNQPLAAVQASAPQRAHLLTELSAGRPALLSVSIIADMVTPVGAAARLMEPERGDWLLESVEGGATRGRYSLLGLAPDLVFRVDAGGVAINRHWATDRGAFAAIEAAPIDALRRLVEECRIADLPAGLPAATACLVGYFGYECYGFVEQLTRPAADPLDVPDMMFVRPSIILVFDQLTDVLTIIAPLWPETGDAGSTAEAKVGAAEEAIEATIARLNAPLVRRYDAAPATEPAAAAEPASALEPGAYAAMVSRAQEYIAAGDIFQVVLAQRFSAPFALPPFDLYRSLRRVNPSPFLYFLDLPGFAVVGSSPEILVRVRDGDITIRPIAGTRPRGADAAGDAANRASLLADPKERAEHLMLLDLGRNDVGRAAAGGTVRVTDSFTVENYSHVMHIVSNVTGRLAPGHDALDALFAGFPAGTVSGAPKVRAAQIIAELESEVRGPYAGGIGYFAPDGTMDSCIVLRTGLIKDGILHVTAGAGIVADSIAASEQAECEAKAGALFAAAREANRIASETGYGQ